MSLIKTAERVSLSPSDNFVFQRSLLAYKEASKCLHGKVLEIGTGSGYGIDEIAPQVEEFWTLDKHYIPIDYNKYPNTRFIKTTVPPLENLPDHYFDFVICFQVIEHIDDYINLLNEVRRVLNGNGQLIITTPNKNMTLTRNPWHIKEFTGVEFDELLRQIFKIVEAKGVFGNEKVWTYYRKNKVSVQNILKYDIFRLNQILPRWMLKVPYDLFNRLNRLWLLKKNRELTDSISLNDYYVDLFSEECFDLFYIAKK